MSQSFDYPHEVRRDKTEETVKEASLRREYFESELKPQLTDLLEKQGFFGIGFDYKGSVAQQTSNEQSDIDIELTGVRNLKSDQIPYLVPTVNRLLLQLEPKYHIHVWEHAGAGYISSRSIFNEHRNRIERH